MFTINTNYLSLLFVRWEPTDFSKTRTWTPQLCDFYFRELIAVRWESLAVSTSILHLCGLIQLTVLFLALPFRRNPFAFNNTSLHRFSSYLHINTFCRSTVMFILGVHDENLNLGFPLDHKLEEKSATANAWTHFA
jgi:hypothetical protein